LAFALVLRYSAVNDQRIEAKMSTRTRTSPSKPKKTPTSRSKSKTALTTGTIKTAPKPTVTKSSTDMSTAAKTTPSTSAPKPTVVNESTPTSTAPMMKKKELIEAVVERSGVRKKFAKPAMEAMMEILGEAIAEGRDLNLPPMGKIKHQRVKEASNARITVAKIRQSKNAGQAPVEGDTENPKQGVAETAE